MRTFFASALLGLLVLVAARADDAALMKEFEAMAGRWNLLKLETGASGRNEPVDGAFVEIAKDGKSALYNRGGKGVTIAIMMEPAKTPKEIDMTPAGSKQPLRGIYKIENDVMTVCYGRKDDIDRPKEFAVTRDEKFILMTMQRAR